MGLVKTRRLAAMQKQQKAKAGMKIPKPKPDSRFAVSKQSLRNGNKARKIQKQ